MRFATDGLLGFQTFFFDDTWTGLTQVQFRALGPGMAYDNIVVDEPVGVTEPSVLLLVAGGLITLALRRGRQHDVAAATTGKGAAGLSARACGHPR